MTKFLSAVTALVVAAGCIAPAKADPIREIALLIDSSGSMDSTEYDLQKNGYINALTALLVGNGLNAIGVWQFSTDSSVSASIIENVFPMTTIASAGDKSALLTALAGMTQIGNNTPIGDAINVAMSALLVFLGNGATGVVTEIIDVSTDGLNNFGDDPADAAAAAVLAGVDQVNCLGVGGAADCSFIAGNGAFALAVDTFDDFEAAIFRKLQREFGVPEPASMAIFGLGLAGLGIIWRRRR